MSDPTAALRAISGAEPSDTAVGLPNIPAVPSTDNYALNNILSSVKLWIEKASGNGLTGFASKQDLVRAGLIQTDSAGNVISSVDLDLSIPPVPTGPVGCARSGARWKPPAPNWSSSPRAKPACRPPRWRSN